MERKRALIVLVQQYKIISQFLPVPSLRVPEEAVPLLTTVCVPLLIWVYSENVFGTSRNDNTTGNNGKRNDKVQTQFSFEVFFTLSEIAGHQLLYTDKNNPSYKHAVL